MAHQLHVAFVWHMHQPLYKDRASGAYLMPWVRLHATKDYLDMVAILKDYPSHRQTFNLVPGERKGDLALRLYTGGTVEGTVRTADGQTVGGAEVQLYIAQTMPGVRIDPKNLKATADENGRFKIGGIEVGERLQLYASAQKPGYSRPAAASLT